MAERPSAAELASENGAVVTAADGTPMQVLKLNDLKRMKITELSQMAHDFGVEGTQGLKKQDLHLRHALRHRGQEVRGARRGRDGAASPTASASCAARTSDYQPSPDDIYVSP